MLFGEAIVPAILSSILLLIFSASQLWAGGLPAVTRNIPYADDANPRQTLDLYLPANRPAPLVLWIHGGGWKSGEKTWINVPYLVARGYAIASVDYRFSTEAVFPAQIRDCNAALNFLLKNAETYGLDKNRVAVAGGSAGGHLALLLALARDETGFGADASFRPRAVLDFFGPTDFTFFTGPPPAGAEDMVGQLLGAPVRQRPDLAKAASPVTYVTAASPPILILHGEKDDLVPVSQSLSLADAMKKADAKCELMVVPGAGHDGPLFSSPAVQQKVLGFLQQNLPPLP